MKPEKMTKKSVIYSTITVIAVGAIVIFGVSPQLAQAGLWSDLWQKLSKSVPLSDSGKSPQMATLEANSQAVGSLAKPVLDYEQAVVAAVKKAAPAVVAITISKNVPVLEQCPMDPFADLPQEFQPFFGGDMGAQFYTQCPNGTTKLQEVGGGSGFIVSDNGLILTNKHVVSDEKASYTVFTNDGKKYDATVLARDPAQDLAVLQIQASSLPTVELGDSDSLELGQTAIAIGNALGEYRNTVSVGVVSGLSRNVTASGQGSSETIQGVIQTDAAINPGNSGGPLLNLRGQVVGINTAVATNAQNVGFAMPINRAKKDIGSVRATGTIQSPYLGVRYMLLTPDLAKAQKITLDHGALVRGSNDGPAVQPGSPAEKAGVMAEDIITSINGKQVDADHPLSGLISDLSIGQTVNLVVNRAGREVTLAVTIGKRP